MKDQDLSNIGFGVFSIGAWDKQAYSFIRFLLETHIQTVLFPDLKSKVKKIKMRQNIAEKSGKNYSLKKNSTCSETLSWAFSPSSSPLKTCVNSSQSSICFLSRRNKTNECTEILIHYRNLAGNVDRPWKQDEHRDQLLQGCEAKLWTADEVKSNQDQSILK